MDAREQLRRYLEQRREAGERELVLDGLTVDEVMRLVGAASSRPGQPATASPRTATPGTPGAPGAPAAPAPPQASADWREVLRGSGASPDAAETRRPAREVRPSEPPSADAATPAVPMPEAASAAEGALAPDGIAVGGSLASLSQFSAALPTLDAIAQAVASCTRCPLYATAKNPVPGEGNPNADLMVVGEAPGATEDEQGRPFVGAAGQLLTKILAAVDLRREDVFICNVLKHRPPGNRNPMPDEVTACSPYLARQIELVRPKAILALGTFAAQTLLQTKLAIGKLRSHVHRYHGVPLIVTYHPAALLRNPSWKRPTWEDVQLVRRILDRPVAEP